MDLASLADQPRDERNAQLLELARAGHFDFLDFGSHKGGGFEVGRMLGGERGLGVELNDAKVVGALREGFPVYSGDIAEFPSDGMRLKFAVARHILEHMPSKDIVRDILGKLRAVCTDFIYIEQPNFDDAGYLDRLGLTLVHSTLQVHTCRLSRGEMVGLLRELGVDRYLLGGQHPIGNSANKWVHVAGSPPNRWIYSADDLPKPVVQFDRVLYRDMVLLGALRDGIDLARLAAGIKLFRFL